MESNPRQNGSKCVMQPLDTIAHLTYSPNFGKFNLIAILSSFMMTKL